MRQYKQPGGKLNKSNIVRVSFFEPVDGRQDYFFGSLRAIFERFTPDQVATSIWKLWDAHAGKGERVTTKTCTITREELLRLKQKQMEQ